MIPGQRRTLVVHEDNSLLSDVKLFEWRIKHVCTGSAQLKCRGYAHQLLNVVGFVVTYHSYHQKRMAYIYSRGYDGSSTPNLPGNLLQ
jgi:hypothetical protein